MLAILRNIGAITLGLLIGSFVNMGIIILGGNLIPPPEGADVLTMEGLKASIHLFQPKHFVMPFLAHALGTFFGSLITSLIAYNHKFKLSLSIGILFMLGGIANIYMLPSPLWFTFVDLIGAYLPMAYLGWKLLAKK